MIALALLLLTQGRGDPRGTIVVEREATIGDTVVIERVVGDVGGAVLRPQVWQLGVLGQQLGPAEVVQGARGMVVRYALVLWYPGEQLLSMPGPVLVRRDGSSDTLPAASYRVRVASVLPAGERRSTLKPKPARDALPIESRSLLPLLLLAGAVILSAGVVALLRLRKGRPLPPRPRVEVFVTPELLRRWGEAGEYRAALDGWAWRLARRLAWSRDLEESARLQKVLDEIADTVFVPNAAEHLAALCERAAALEPR
ncbi:MAG TPA: hypothetical protein VL241_04830 [Gemmatimonadales bacterium]|nr:hypothetical protein [Gemmatimonadales bacterium]